MPLSGYTNWQNLEQIILTESKANNHIITRDKVHHRFSTTC